MHQSVHINIAVLISSTRPTRLAVWLRTRAVTALGAPRSVWSSPLATRPGSTQDTARPVTADGAGRVVALVGVVAPGKGGKRGATTSRSDAGQGQLDHAERCGDGEAEPTLAAGAEDILGEVVTDRLTPVDADAGPVALERDGVALDQ